MKTSRILILAVSLMAAVGFTAGAAPVSLEVGGVGYFFNTLAANQKATNPQPITSSLDISPDPYINGSYTMTLNDTTKLKVGLLAEDMMGTTPPSYIYIARAEPYADFSAGGLSARVSFPLYFMGYDSVNDPKQAEIAYVLDSYYKGINLSTDYALTPAFLFTNYENVAYRFNFSKTTALVLSASTEIGLVPAFWVYDVKPQATFVLGPLQIDLKESIYFANSSSTSPSTSDTAYNLRFFTDPKLTFNFSDLGVKGLKAYVGASLFTFQNFPNQSVSAWYNTSSGAAKAYGSSITPGLSYTTGPLYVEAAFKWHNYDDSVSNPAGKDPTFDPMLKVSYTFSF